MLNVSIEFRKLQTVCFPAVPPGQRGSITDYSGNKETIIIFGCNSAGDCATIQRSHAGLSVEQGSMRALSSVDLETIATIVRGHAFTLAIEHPKFPGKATLIFELQ